MIDFAEKLDAVRQAVSDIMAEPKKVALTGCALLVLMAAVALVVILTGRPKPKKVIKLTDEPLVLEDELLVPEAQVYNEDYITSRVTQEKWSIDDVKKNFTPPNATQLSDLRKVNDRAVRDLVESAP